MATRKYWTDETNDRQDGERMEATLAVSSTSQLEQDFLRDFVLIKAVSDWADKRHWSPVLEGSRFESTLKGAEGQAVASRWARSFRQSLALLDKFHENYMAGATADKPEWHKVVEASDRILKALERKLGI
jgi:hypothetical protein